MTSIAGRKKSIVSSIDQPVANNTLLNKSAAQSTSLYQQCAQLKARLMRIRDFPRYFALSPDAHQSSDPVTQLWDLFSFGIPLCFLFDLLPAPLNLPKINLNDFDSDKFQQNPDRAKKHAVALFAMQIRSDKTSAVISDLEPFMVTELINRETTDGLVKVVNNVTVLVDLFPPEVFEDESSLSPSFASSESVSTLAVPQTPSGKEGARINIINELVTTERKYVADLEVMQKYSSTLFQQNVLTQDVIAQLFPNLNSLVNFQRRFLIQMESLYVLPWQEQQWGSLFSDKEPDFEVYVPYCSNYASAEALSMQYSEKLSALDMISNTNELQAFLIKPIQRVCKYPLLLESLIKVTNADDYPFYAELQQGQEAAKRIALTINEAQRQSENVQTVRNLQRRIEDWKGHHLESFGELLLDELFVVTKSDLDREYHVFLFEKIILCCKEALQPGVNGVKKSGKTNSILKKQGGPTPGMATTMPRKDSSTPLLLKGRIFLSNVTQAVAYMPGSAPPPGAPGPPRSSQTPLSTHALAVWWKGDDDMEYFTLRCRTEEQMRQWESKINGLIKDAAQRRANERSARQNQHVQNWQAMQTDIRPDMLIHPSLPRTSSVHATQLSMDGNYASPGGRYTHERSGSYFNGSNTPNGNGPNGYPPHEGFDVDFDDEYEDYPSSSHHMSSSYAVSGRGTPVGARRNNGIVSMPPSRDANGMQSSYERVRAQTEDAGGPLMSQWRNQGGVDIRPPPLPQPGSASSMSGGLRPVTPRIQSSAGGGAYPHEVMYGNGDARPSQAQRPQLKSQFSSSRMRSLYEEEVSPRTTSRAAVLPLPAAPVMSAGSSNGGGSRVRSASQPQAYVPKQPNVPPVPQWNTHRSQVSVTGGKRASGSSEESTADSSDYSPNSSSPVTPFGSSDSSLLGGGVHPGARAKGYADASHVNGHHHPPSHHMPSQPQLSPPVKIKVHFHEDIFVIQVPRSTEYNELVEKVGRKIRLCGPRREDGPLRVKYQDEDGDMVSLGSTDDVQMAFEQYRPGGQVTLFVT